MKEIQDFEWENISMSRPTFDSTPIGLKKYFTISPQKNGKEHFTIAKWKRTFHHFTIAKQKKAFHQFNN